MDVELARACGPNVIDTPFSSGAEYPDSGYGDSSDGWGDGDGSIDGWGDGDGSIDGWGDGDGGGGGGGLESGYGRDVGGAQHYPAVSRLEALNTDRMLELARVCGAVLIVNSGVVKAVFSGTGGGGDAGQAG